MTAVHRTEPPKVALITGGAVRVGKAIALELAGAGLDVALTYHTSRDAACETLAELRAMGGRAMLLEADLREPDAPAEVVDAIAQRWGALDVLVNSAASFVFQDLQELSSDSFDAQVALNVRAPLLLAQAAAPLLAQSAAGRIINIADASASRPFKGQLVHSLTKAALVNLTRGLARELGPAIQCHAVIPGAVAPPQQGPSDLASRLTQLPIPREGTPRDVAEAVRFLATCTSFATGTILHIDGGDSCVGLSG